MIRFASARRDVSVFGGELVVEFGGGRPAETADLHVLVQLVIQKVKVREQLCQLKELN